MRISLEQPAQRWASQYPRTVNAVSALHEAGVRVALSSSRLTHLVAEATGKIILRQPDDTDLLVPREDLLLAFSLLGKGAKLMRDRRPEIPTGDGYVARFAADELIYLTDTTIQMVCPTGPMYVGDHKYNTAYTEQAAAAREVYETSEGFVPVATTDSLYLYGVLQRTHGAKTDMHNAAVLRSSNCLDNPYAALRAVEMWLDNRALRFASGIGTLGVPQHCAMAAA